jgi:trimeric autotransporter adhesin
MAWSRAGRAGRAGAGRRMAVTASTMALVAATAMAGGHAEASSQPGGRADHPDVGAGVITTIAGGVGGPARATGVSLPACGLSSSSEGLYIGASITVRLVSPQTDWLTTPVGSMPEIIGGHPHGNGGPAAYASLGGVCGVAVDHAGNLVIADAGEDLLQVVARISGTFYGQSMTAGHIYPVAGDGHGKLTVNGAPATENSLNYPEGVAVDAAGNVVITSYDGYVHVLAENTGNYYGQSMTVGDLYNVAGGGTTLGDGGPATKAELYLPEGVAVDSHGNILIADLSGNRVRVVAESNGSFYGMAMTAGDIYSVAGDGVQGYSGDGGPGTSAELDRPEGVAVDSAGNLLLTDSGNNRVRVVAGSTGTFYSQAMTVGDIYTIAGNGSDGFSGNGGPATSAAIDGPGSISVDGAGNVLISGQGRVRLVAASTGTRYGQSMTAGDIYSIAGNGKPYSGARGPAKAAVLYNQDGVAVDGAGNLLIANTGANEIWVSAVHSGTFYGTAMTAGKIYIVAGDGQRGSAGIGGPATKAKLDRPTGVAADGQGNLLIAGSAGQRVQVVAGSTGMFYGQSMTAGNLYTIAGTGMAGFSGDGGPATSAKLSYPNSVTVDSVGNILIADVNNNRIRVVAASTGVFYGQSMTAGDIYSIAGGGGSVGDGGPATSADLDEPKGVAVDAAGNVLIAEAGDSRIRVVAESNGTYYGVKMTVGDIYTVAGDGLNGNYGDDRLAINAELNGPSGVTSDGGNLIISDTNNNRLREVAS